jgi:hypothetical protein
MLEDLIGKVFGGPIENLKGLENELEKEINQT